MRLVACAVAAPVLLCSPVLAQSPSDRISLEELEARKAGSVSGVNEPLPDQGGETIETAVEIPALPYSDSGNTCSNVDDYDEACPFINSTSPDVVYRYQPGSDVEVDIDLCASGYDTKVYVYENDSSTLVACNDDACGSDGFRSRLVFLPLAAGETYYIVVDGYFGACGSYDLEITEGPGLVCPPGAQFEAEPVCFDDYKDAFNGGCNSTPNAFSFIVCGDPATVCAEYGGYFHGPSGFQYRDTDWYELAFEFLRPGAVVTATGVYASLFGYLDSSLGCDAPVFQDFLSVEPLVPASFVLPTNPVWIFAATSGFGAEAGACGGDYLIVVDEYGCPIISVEEATWGSIKSRYSRK